MRCRQARQDIVESRPEQVHLALTEHLSHCNPCRRMFEEKVTLDTAIARLRADAANVEPSRTVEENILAILDGSLVQKQHTTWAWQWIAASVLICAAVLMGAAFIPWHYDSQVGPIHPSTASTASEPFTAMPYVVPPAPYERTSVVRTYVSLQMMLAAGFQVHGGELGSKTLADVLYGEDGRILAIRLVSQPIISSYTRMD